MSEQSNTFIQSNLERESVSAVETPNEERSFELNEMIIQNPSVRRGFTYDSENARNFDQSNVNKAKEGVKELLKDALDKAKRQATDIKENAKKEGYDAGYADGFKKGEDAAREEFDPFLETINCLIADLTVFRKDMYDKVEREMIQMVVDLAKKVIHFEFSTRDDAVQEMIRLAVQSVMDRESMVIKINPAEKGYAESFRPELHHLFSEIKNITFEAHTGVKRGGCVVETNFGVVDARIDMLEEQMDRILNLAPPPPEGLIAASKVEVEPEVEPEADVETESPIEDQIEPPAEENDLDIDPEIEPPEETS